MNEALQQLVMALMMMAQAIEKSSGPKAVVRDQFGNIVGIEPVN